jgi:hypothetical protein
MGRRIIRYEIQVEAESFTIKLNGGADVVHGQNWAGSEDFGFFNWTCHQKNLDHLWAKNDHAATGVASSAMTIATTH